MLRVRELDKEMSGEDRFHLENRSTFPLKTVSISKTN